MSRVENAVELFSQGYSCSQAVLAAYCEDFGMDKTLALKVSCGFGGGIGRQGEACGAVSGAVLLIGLKYGKVLVDDMTAKEKTYEMVQEFFKRFKARNEFIRCNELLGMDLMNGDKNKLGEKVKIICPKMVRDAAEIVEVLLEIH
jgi:C_GCAxxG_C_C family probable redox protein